MAFNWFFPQDVVDHKTPSRMNDGIPLAMEMRYRKEGAKLVINAANNLNLRYDTVATGVVFYHRFFMMQSFQEFNRWVVAAACLLLAGKVEETPKQCKVILKEMRSLLNNHQWAGFGTNPKEELITHEKILLQTIKFDLQIEHPYSFILKFAKELKGSGDKAEIEKIVQAAWTFVNDSLVTTLSIQWEPQAVAVAFIYLAAKLSKYDIQSKYGSKSRSWWRQFVGTLDSHDLDCICHQVLDIYQESGKDTSDDQQSDEEQSSSQSNKSSQSIAVPNPPPSGPNGQVPIVPPAITTLPTQPTAWNTLSTTVASLMGQMQSAFPNNQQYPQTQSSFQSQPNVGMTTFTLANPLQALQNIRSATAIQPPQAQYTSTSQQQLYGVTTLQNPSQTMVPRLVQPGAQLMGGVYPQQPQQYTSAQPNYQSQVKAQQPSYSLLGQTGVVAPVGGQGYAVNPGQVVYPPSLLPRVGGTQPNSGQNTYTTPYHQSTIAQGTKTQQLVIPPPRQQIHPNTSYTNYGTQTASYLPPVGVRVQGSAQQPPQVGRVSGLMPGRTPVYPPAARGHTPNKPGSGRWGMR